MRTICFTGHRPPKLGGYDWNTSANQKILLSLSKQILELILGSNEKNLTFVFGGALGIDQMAFEIVYALKGKAYLKGHNIKLVLAIPYENFGEQWFSQVDIRRFESQKEHADDVVYVDTLPKYLLKRVPIGKYHPIKLQLRNQYMVDISDLVFAVWNGTIGGTKNCMDYAVSQNKTIYLGKLSVNGGILSE